MVKHDRHKETNMPKISIILSLSNRSRFFFFFYDVTRLIVEKFVTKLTTSEFKEASILKEAWCKTFVVKWS